MLSQKKILVVEDNAINREMLRAILSAEYEVLEAKNGKEALEVLNEFGENISLILLDIVMPVMDGYTFLSVVKENSAYSAIPVIVTTQSDGESDEVTALSHGAADFVAKPYKPQIILHRVASIINLRETAAMINLIQYDRLTGLYSKEFFYQRVKEILIRNPDREYDIVCSDIENFKLVNDAFGIPAGDRLLCDVAALYKDRVGNRGICGRFNADQFACLLEHRWTYTNDLFLEALNQINELTNARNVVMKWGIYRVKGRSASVEQMCDRALLAAQSIKGQYGKYFAEYNDELRNKLLREQAITDEMEQALEQGQFEIYLQPKYRIKDDSLAGAEALVRWNHPKWGIQSPAEFIPLFEKNGFITKLDQYVWDKTCRVLHEWEDKGYPELSVSVNVSRADIYHADLVGILVHTVKKYGLPPSRLHLEITESAYTENPKQIIDTVNNLREQGFVIEMDDFGSGYSSLNMLNDMPIDVLKLDMKFIQNETAKPVNQGILRFIMGLARWMNLSVVAEGVETGEQLERLREIGCDFVQGYFFAKPMPCAEFESLMVPQGGLARQSVSEMGREKQVLLVADENEEYRERVRKTFEDR
ncbi:MAG: EAL domain-containing protein [Neglectibacter timonensis]